MTSGIVKMRHKYVVFEIVNTGDRPITVTGMGWKTGYWKKRQAIQIFETGLSSPLPMKLDHGEQGKWYISMDAGDGPWPEYFAKFLMPHYRRSCASLRGQAYLSVGHILNAEPDDLLLKELRETCEELATKNRERER